MADISLLSWRTLTNAVVLLKTPPSLILDLLFPQERRVTNVTDTIDVHITKFGQKLAPFTRRGDPAKLADSPMQELRSVKAPHIRLKKNLPATQVMLRMAPGTGGSNLYIPNGPAGANAIQANINRSIAATQLDLKTRVVRTWIWMIWQMLKGRISVTQDDGVAFEIDFRFSETHKPVLVDDARWSNPDALIMDNIRDWKSRIREDSGYEPTLMFVGSSAGKNIRKNKQVVAELGNLKVFTGEVKPGKDGLIATLENLAVYQIDSSYTDENGASQKFVGEDDVIILSPDGPFSLQFGLITDLKAVAQVVSDFFAKEWITEDPSEIWELVESDPLPIITEPNVIVYAQT